MRLIQGQSKVRIEIEADMLNGGQQLQSLLENGIVKIEYAYRDFSGEDETGTWMADGFFMEGLKPIVYYNFKNGDVIPEDCRYILGRLVVEDPEGRVVLGDSWSIKVHPNELY